MLAEGSALLAEEGIGAVDDLLAELLVGLAQQPVRVAGFGCGKRRGSRDRAAFKPGKLLAGAGGLSDGLLSVSASRWRTCSRSCSARISRSRTSRSSSAIRAARAAWPNSCCCARSCCAASLAASSSRSVVSVVIAEAYFLSMNANPARQDSSPAAVSRSRAAVRLASAACWLTVSRTPASAVT
jgi:hypothetical protein